MTKNALKIALKHPITVDGRKVKKLNVRRPKMRDMESMDKVSGEMAKTVMLLAELTDLTPDQVREIDGEDFILLSDAVSDFLDGV